MKRRMNFITNYMNDAEKRHMMNDLTRRTFCFDFEDWVTGGFCEGTYIPYSFEENGRIVSNASANIMDFVQNGKRRKYIQIGTVMTDEAYRRRGLAGKLVRKILDDNLDSCDGVYLFANLDALDFYRAMRLSESTQYQYTLKKGAVNSSERGLFQPAVEGLKEKNRRAVRASAVNSALEQVNNFSLQMFYTADMEDVYYSDELDCFSVWEMCGETLYLKSVIAERRIPLAEVVSRLGAEYGSLVLGFAPLPEDAPLFECALFDGGDNYRLFYLGSGLESIYTEKLMFPELSHA